MWVAGRLVQISGTSITNSTNGYAEAQIGSGSSGNGDNRVAIYRIEAWSGGASIGFGGGSGGGGGGSQIDLLWTNPNPTSVFAGQTVSAAWQGYKFVIIETYTDAYNSFPAHFESHTVPAQSGNRYSISVFREAPITRSVNFEDSGIRFGAQGWFSSYNTGDITWNDSYAFIIPTRIWGVKDGGGASGVVETTCTLDTTYASTSRSTVKVYKNGGVCTITFLPLILKAQSGRHTFGTVPEGFRPVGGEYYIHPNSWSSADYLIVGTDGTLKANVNLGGENESYASGTYVIGG